MSAAFLVTIDTEADNEWRGGQTATFENIRALQDLQALCDRYGVKPTYLVTYDVAADDASRSILQGLHAAGNCEIGAHLHAWSTPPEHPLPAGMFRARPYLHEYPAEVQTGKLRNLTQCLRDAFGVEARSYRGGRWSLDGHAVRDLLAAGYLVDTTVTPGFTWEANPGYSPGAFGPSFLRAPLTPYRLGPGDTSAPAGTGLLEVPVSILPRGLLSWLPKPCRVPPRLAVFHALWRRLLDRTGLCREVWLRPGLSSPQAMIWLTDRLRRRDAPVLNLMFHSSELEAGVGPQMSSKCGAAEILASLELLFAHVTGTEGAECLTLTEFAIAYPHPTDCGEV